MSSKPNRLSPARIQEDRDAFAALQAIAGYTPNNPAYAISALTAATARDEAAAREWEFHDLILGAKDQIRAQFGKDSTEVQAVGLKRRSEYSRPKPRAKKEGE